MRAAVVLLVLAFSAGPATAGPPDAQTSGADALDAQHALDAKALSTRVQTYYPGFPR